MEKTKKIKNPNRSAKQQEGRTSAVKKFSSFGWVSQKEILFFTKNLAVMLKSGSTLAESLDVLQKETKGKLRTILNDVYEEVSRGYKFSESLRRYPKVFSEIYTNMLQIGEESGRLEENLEQLVLQLQRSYALRKKIIGALTYPAIVFVGGLIVSLGVVIFVLPKVVVLFKSFGAGLPITTRVMIAISNFFQLYGVWAIPTIFVVLIFLFWLLRRDFLKSVTHWFILHTPVVKTISKDLNLSIFYQTMATLLTGCVTIDDGLKICAKVIPNYYYRKFLINAYGKIKAGSSLTNVLREKRSLFPATDAQIINVGEESGTLCEAMNYCFEIHDGELDDITKNLSTILEPFLLILIGFMVGFLALSIITPIYSIVGQMQ